MNKKGNALRFLTLLFVICTLSACLSEKNSEEQASSVETEQQQEVKQQDRALEKADVSVPVINAEKKKAGIASYQPHKALYKVTMIGTKSSSQILDVSGDMYYELSKNCTGWITNHNFNLIYSYVDIGNVNLKSDFSTFESHDGEIFEYTSQRRRDGRLFEQYKGGVVPENIETGRQAVYDTPEGLRFNLSPGTIFPIAHTIKILELFDTNQKFYNAIVFDGSDDTGPYEINAFIGDNASLDTLDINIDSDDIDGRLLETQARKVRLAFFPVLEEERTESEYEMTLFFHRNGVVSEMVIEYPEFTVKQSLEAIEALEQPSCGE